VSEAVLKLTVYFGESDRVGGRLVSDGLCDLFERREVRAALLLRGVEGFGAKQLLHTDRFLTLSEDLPLVALAVDDEAAIRSLAPDVERLVRGGLVTVERLRPAGGGELPEPAKLTVHLGRDDPYVAVVEHLRRAGLAGASVLLGVDGMAHGRRRRARFLSRNESVPLLIVSVGSAAAAARALEGLPDVVADAVATIERVEILKRDGARLAELPSAPAGTWQKLTVYAGEQARHRRRPLHVELVRRLRAAHASGATTLRGVWGFSGDHAPHGDRLLAVHRRVPVLTTVVDDPDRVRSAYRIVDELTDETGLVTVETVPTVLLPRA